MTEHMVKYMQKRFYEGLNEKDSLKADATLEWFNNNGVFIEDENNFLCNKCPLIDCLECKDVIDKEDYLIDEAYNNQWCYNCKNFGKLKDEPYICGEDDWCEYWEEKRFKWDIIDGDIAFYKDNTKIDYDDVVDLLNESFDENEQLKQEIETLHEQLAHIGDVE